jgi:hypothetical protein
LPARVPARLYRWRRVELRQLKPAVAVRGPHQVMSARASYRLAAFGHALKVVAHGDDFTVMEIKT